MSDRILWIIVVVLAVMKMALVGWWPFLAFSNLPHDTTMFLEHAMSILEGEWLGPYTEFTLMKGPVLPMWIALMNFLGIPLLVSHHLLYIGACVLAMVAFRRFTTSNGFLLLTFTILLFNPFTFNYGPIASAFREMLQQPLILGFIALSVILFVDFIRHRAVHTGWSVLFGVLLFMMWNNREDSVWMVPLLIWLLLAMLADVWMQWERDGRASAGKLIRLTMIPVLIWWGGTLAIAWKNYVEYDVFAVVELKTPEFKRAFNGVLSIKAEDWKSKFTGQEDVLEKLYSLPSGSELYLGEKQLISSMIMPWMFRSAVRQAGYYDRGGKAVLAYYDRLGREIEIACAEKRFECVGTWLSLFPPWHPGYTHGYLSNVTRVLEQVLKIDPQKTIDDFLSIGTRKFFLAISRLVNSPVRAFHPAQELPYFYKRMKKNKTKYQKRIWAVYGSWTPVLFWIAVAGLLPRLFSAVRYRRVTPLDIVYLGLAGSVLVQVLMFALLKITGYSDSPRLYFMLYPVLFSFILTGLLSLTRDAKYALSLLRSSNKTV